MSASISLVTRAVAVELAVRAGDRPSERVVAHDQHLLALAGPVREPLAQERHLLVADALLRPGRARVVLADDEERYPVDDLLVVPLRIFAPHLLANAMKFSTCCCPRQYACCADRGCRSRVHQAAGLLPAKSALRSAYSWTRAAPGCSPWRPLMRSPANSSAFAFGALRAQQVEGAVGVRQALALDVAEHLERGRLRVARQRRQRGTYRHVVERPEHLGPVVAVAEAEYGGARLLRHIDANDLLAGDDVAAVVRAVRAAE